MKIDTKELYQSIEKLDAMFPSAQRLDKLYELEVSLVKFEPDALDALDLLQAWLRGLINRYGKDQLSDVLHECAQLEEALQELDRTTGEA